MNEPNFRLDGRCALITGAGRGIGLGIARAYAALGAKVAIQDIDLDVAEAEAKQIRDAGGFAVALGGDATRLDFAPTVVAQARDALGGLHILLNNAAIQQHKHWMELAAEEIEGMLRADIVVPLLLCQQVVPIFKEQRWGRIINLGSIQQLGGNPHMLPYSASKAALANMTKALARDLAREGITVNLLAPGWFDTYRNRRDWSNEQEKAEAGKRAVPIGRIGEPQDCAGAAVLLASEAGGYITGQSIFVDGGMSAR